MTTRRTFIAGLGAAAAWPFTARGQQKLPVIGYLNGQSPNAAAQALAAFRQGLNETGYVEHRNVGIEYRWGEGQYDRLPALAAELVRAGVSVIAATGAPNSPLAAKGATATIPIVFITGADPVKLGLVSSFNLPGGNATGVSFLVNELAQKRLGLLHQLLPAATAIGVLVNSASPNAPLETSDVQAAARQLGLHLTIERASSERDIDAAFASFIAQPVDAVFVTADAFLEARRDQLIALAARHGLPACYQSPDDAAVCGLMSYGPSLTDSHRQVGIYAGRILKGEKPSDLPVLQPTKLDLVINLKTAKALGLAIPSGVIAAADEVIE
jgi:putative tryptophan/tyrosine transport system substrate-binding protein